MSLDWRLPDETTYLAFEERLILSARLHPLRAVYPFVKASVLAVFGLWLWAVFGIIGTVVILAAIVQWVRTRTVLRSVGYWFAAVIVVGVLFTTGFATDTGALILVLLAFGLGVAIYQLVDFYYTQIFLTDQRIFRVSGLLTRSVATMPLRSLTDLRFEKTLLGRAFNYGHFYVESAGQEQALSSLSFISQPGKFYRLVMAEALGSGTSTA